MNQKIIFSNIRIKVYRNKDRVAYGHGRHEVPDQRKIESRCMFLRDLEVSCNKSYLLELYTFETYKSLPFT